MLTETQTAQVSSVMNFSEINSLFFTGTVTTMKTRFESSFGGDF
jgi:hypothetical protein